MYMYIHTYTCHVYSTTFSEYSESLSLLILLTVLHRLISSTSEYYVCFIIISIVCYSCKHLFQNKCGIN